MKLPNYCENSNSENYGLEGELLKEKSGNMFDYTDLYREYNCRLTEYVLFPYADFCSRIITELSTDDHRLFLTGTFTQG